MSPQMVLDIMQESFKVSLFLAMPALLSALFVGVLISVVQSVTSIQEQTLVFVPKMLAVMLSLMLFIAWMINVATHYTETLFRGIPDFIK